MVHVPYSLGSQCPIKEKQGALPAQLKGSGFRKGLQDSRRGVPATEAGRRLKRLSEERREAAKRNERPLSELTDRMGRKRRLLKEAKSTSVAFYKFHGRYMSSEEMMEWGKSLTAKMKQPLTDAEVAVALELVLTPDRQKKFHDGQVWAATSPNHPQQREQDAEGEHLKGWIESGLVVTAKNRKTGAQFVTEFYERVEKWKSTGQETATG